MPFVWIAALAACKGEEAAEDTSWHCVVPSDLAEGRVEATIDGADWSTTSATYRWAKTSLQITTVKDDGWWFSAVAQSTDEQVTADVAVADGEFPIYFPMESGQEGGFATLYPDDGDSFATQSEGGGVMVLTDDSDDDLWGCLLFDATDDETTLRVDAAFRAIASEL